MEGARRCHSRSGCLITHVIKVSHVRTLNLVAKDLAEDEDRLFDVAMEMDPKTA